MKKNYYFYLLALCLSNNFAQVQERNIYSESTEIQPEIQIDSRCLALRPEEIVKIQLELKLRNRVKDFDGKKEKFDEIVNILNQLNPLNEEFKKELIKICQDNIEIDSENLKELDTDMNKKGQTFKMLAYANVLYFVIGAVLLENSVSQSKSRHFAYGILASSPIFIATTGLVAIKNYADYALKSMGLTVTRGKKHEIITLLS